MVVEPPHSAEPPPPPNALDDGASSLKNGPKLRFDPRVELVSRPSTRGPATCSVSEILSALDVPSKVRLCVEAVGYESTKKVIDVEKVLRYAHKPSFFLAEERSVTYEQMKELDALLRSSLCSWINVDRIHGSLLPWQKAFLDILVGNGGFLEAQVAYHELLMRLEYAAKIAKDFGSGGGEEELPQSLPSSFLSWAVSQEREPQPDCISCLAFTMPFHSGWYTVIPSPIRDFMLQKGGGIGGERRKPPSSSLLHAFRLEKQEQGEEESEGGRRATIYLRPPDVLLATLLFSVDLRKNPLKLHRRKRRGTRRDYQQPRAGILDEEEAPASAKEIVVRSAAKDEADILKGAMAGRGIGTEGILGFICSMCLEVGLFRFQRTSRTLTLDEKKAAWFFAMPAERRIGLIVSSWESTRSSRNEFASAGMIQYTTGGSWGVEWRPRPRKRDDLSSLPHARRDLCRFILSTLRDGRAGQAVVVVVVESEEGEEGRGGDDDDLDRKQDSNQQQSPWYDYDSLKAEFVHRRQDFLSECANIPFVHLNRSYDEEGIDPSGWSFKSKMADAIIEVLWWLGMVELLFVPLNYSGAATGLNAGGGEEEEEDEDDGDGAARRGGKARRPERNAGVLLIRLTDSGSRLLLGGGKTRPTPAAGTAESGPRITVTPSFDAVVPLEPCNHQAIFILERLLERTSTGSAFVYRISPSKITKREDYSLLLRFLRESSTLPPNVEHELLHWGKRSEGISLSEGRTVVVVKEDDLLSHELLGIEEVRKCLESYSKGSEPRVFVVRRGATERLMKLLKKRGFLFGSG